MTKKKQSIYSMKTLNEYVNERVNREIQQHYIFYSTDHIDTDKEDYTQVLPRLYCSDDTATDFIKALDTRKAEARNIDLRENGRKNIIRRELYRHDAISTLNKEDIYSFLEPYGITPAEILEVMNE